MTDRDTHFLGFARLQMPELDSLFAVLYHAYATGDMAKRDEYSNRIETYLAQRAYDLMAHIIDHAPASVSDADDWSIPDLTQWPD